MPFPLSNICTLLQRLENIETRDPPFLRKDEKAANVKDVTLSWFASHRRHINELSIQGATALLSSLLPGERTDRVYGVQSPSLCRILGRSLGLSASRQKDLEAYKQPGCGDLAQCLQRVLASGGPPARPAISLEEFDNVLDRLASQCHFSDATITNKHPTGSSEDRDRLLGDIFKRAEPNESKWIVRIILKDLSPVQIDEGLTLKAFHFLLPDLLRFQAPFEAAVTLLRTRLQQFPDNPDRRSEVLHRERAAELIEPAINIKVGRPDFWKARSIDHCFQMVGAQKWVLERKYDGEYCEVHVDLTKSTRSEECITIFSKSGKDSTRDRQHLHQTLIDCLRLGQPSCKIKRRAILLGELVVWSDKENRMLPFDKIRKHVTRSGVFLGNEADSQAHEHEHLAIVFFDLLLLDDEIIMSKPVEERRQWLREVYRKSTGRAMSSEWKIVDFSDTVRARRLFVEQFAASIAQRCEGLVLKPCGVPYFSFNAECPDLRRNYIKVKKDLMNGLGDDGDFAVVGASYNAQQALQSGLNGVKWTDFHLGCLVNENEVKQVGARPVFKIVYTIQQEACIPKPILQNLNISGTHSARPYVSGREPAAFGLQVGAFTKIDVVFEEPFVLEVLGAGYDKPASRGFYMLRHARAKKLHRDRTWKDCITFQKLQAEAHAARNVSSETSEETLQWIERLGCKMKRRLQRDGTLTPRSKTTSTPSTRRTTSTTTTVRTSRSEGLHDVPVNVESCLKRPSATVELCSDGLDGTTLVGCDRIERTPCPIPKRRRTTEAQNRGQEAANISRSATTNHPQRLSPLGDITNTASARCGVTVRSLKLAEKVKSPRPVSLTPISSSSEQHALCAGTDCLFSRAVVGFATCVASTPYITQNLLGGHDCLSVSSLQHWDRDSFAHPSGTEVVSESQAYSGLRKIVLVEARRPQAVKNTVGDILGLNQGQFKERIEVYDWRVLEKCHKHIAAPALKSYFIGATLLDEGRQRLLFVSTIPGLSHA